MKKFLIILIIGLGGCNYASAQKVCCPQFRLSAAVEPCDTLAKESSAGGATGNEDSVTRCDIKACKHSTQTYFVYPIISTFTYTWQVTGGVPNTLTGDPMNIVWGNNSTGKITVFISNADGSCRDTVTKNICLVNSPTAAFTFSPTGAICSNTTVQFTNSSTGAVAYYWDFGDGTTSTLENPTHVFSGGGTYNVVLTATSYTGGGGAGTNGSPVEGSYNCGCKDIITKTIIVKKESGISIIPGCKKMLCFGDTASYCAGTPCSSYSWSVTGGHISGSATGSCITVIWDGSYPAKVTLAGNCGGACGNTATINVPVLYPTMPISGDNIVCPASTTGYQLPAMPGTFYNWTISGGGTIIGPDKNTAEIQVQWGSVTGDYTITCDYENPATHCKGKGTISVKVRPKYAITGSAKFCVGDPFLFNANGPGTWAISPGSGYTPPTFGAGSSISGVWNIRGAYTVTATTLNPANFCTLADVKDVIVLDTPKLNPIIGDLIICPGSAQVYSVSSNMNEPMFNWSPITGGNVISLMGTNHDSVVVQWNPTGPYVVSVSQTVNGCSSSLEIFTPNIYLPPTFTGPANTCMDKELTYTTTSIAPPGGYTWSLSNAGGTITTGQGTNTIKILWHGQSGGNATTDVILTTCGGADTLRVYIEMPLPVTVTSSGNVCAGGTTLTASAGSAYLWTPGNFTTQSITANVPGGYIVQVTSPSGGCISMGGAMVAQPPFPPVTISTPDNLIWGCGETINTSFTALPGGAGYCYQWFHNGTPVGTNSQVYTANQTGRYWCLVSLCNTSCSGLSDTLSIIQLECGPGGPGGCNSNYTINVTQNYCNPFNFQVTGNPPAAVTSANWNFGDDPYHYGGLSISHTYSHIGNYRVCVSSVETPPYCPKYTCFTVSVPIVAGFATAVQCKMVTPINLSETLTPGTTTYLWSFPGGTPSSSNLQNPPSVTYNTLGPHTMTLTVSNGTCTETTSSGFIIDFPTGQISIPASVCALTDAPFHGSGTGTGLMYHWDFGDGYISNLQDVSHAYQLPGTYTVTLIVTDKNGCTDVVTKIIKVLPAITVSIGPDQFFCIGTTATFTANPASFLTYQWYKDGVLINGATSASYSTGIMGEYWVVVSNGNGCVGKSNKSKAIYRSNPIAKILKKPVLCKTSSSFAFNLQNYIQEFGCIYNWSCPGVTFSPNGTFGAYSTMATVNAIGDFQVVLEVINSFGCKSRDTLCVSVVTGVQVTVTSPTGPLCEGNIHTFVANATPVLSQSSQYYYQWSNGVVGNILQTGNSGMNVVTATNSYGCSAMAFTTPVNKRADVSLFPVGCDTLCLTDTAHFPLPLGGGLSPSSYTIQWYDSGTPVGTNSVNLPLAAIGAGDHHFYAVVTLTGGCVDTTGTFDLFVKDCTLTPPCDNCNEILSKADFTASSFESGNMLNGVLSFTSLKPLKEVHISIADLAYHWNDPKCINCKVNLSDRACLFPLNATQQVGTLVWDNFSGVSIPPASGPNDCPRELIFKPGVVIPPGTYSIPVQFSFPAPAAANCKLIIDKLCMHILLKDEDCKLCERNLCRPDSIGSTDSSKCGCSAGNNWTNLFLVPLRPGVPKPKTLIFCGSIISGYRANVAYTLSGMYNCRPGCVCVKNEVVIRNQTGDIIYTHAGATLYENILFPEPGPYTITLTAWCGDKKCECTFKTDVTPGTKTPETPEITTDPGGHNPPVTTTVTPGGIDKVLTGILPPDFNGAVLVAQKDSIIYEKYTGNKVNTHTAFDLASVAKTFTAMAVLKMAEEKRLSLNDDAGKYLNGFPFTGITLRMLLSHRSGLEDYVKFLQAPDVDKTKMMSNADLLQYIIANKNKVQIAAPGAAFDYSNTNFALLALIIEKVSGQTYPQYLSDKFFKPLHMDDTYVFGPANSATSLPSYYKNGKPYELKNLDYIFGDKNIYTTVKDMMKWDKALRDGKIFSKETLTLAYTPGSPLVPYQSNYGLGWRILQVPNGKKMVYHNGWWHGMRSVFIRLIDEDAVIIILSNSSFATISESRKLADLFGQYQQAGKSIVNF